MNLKKIEIYGFKSFAEKTEMIFDSSMTAVVGPNGCGKSNVVDTIRWVLGEQSARIMRGKTMQDLIFSGTESRKSMSYCEASLFFDNKNRIFPLDFDEVVISRKLYRSGDSEYLINRNTTRLKDIGELLRNAGMGREGYSIVGQGRMDAVLNAKPFERRGIFEEALGISNFRVKKAETERKLEKNRENMLRMFDITTELERQLGPLKKQAAEAKKFLELSEQIKYHEINTYIYNYDNAATFKEQSMTKIRALDEEINLVGLKFTDSYTRMEKASSAREQLDINIEELHRKETELSVDLTKQSGEAKLNMEKINNLKTSIERLTNEINECNLQIENDKKHLVGLDASKHEKNSEYEVLTKVYANLNENFSKLVSEIAENQDTNEKVQDEINKILEEITEQNGADATLRGERLALSKRITQIDSDLLKRQEKLITLKQAKADIESQIEKIGAEKEFLSNELEKTQSTLLSNEESIAITTKESNRLKQNIAADSTRLEMLNENKENLEGFAGSVKLLLGDCKKDKKLSQLILGVVGTTVKVAEKYEKALMAALGESINTVITANENDAKALIKHLTASDHGKVTFIPGDLKIKAKFDLSSILKEKGVLGSLLSEIKYDKKFSSVFENLLGSYVFVDSLDTAFALSKKCSANLVTLDGDLVLANGEFSGGSSRDATTSIIGLEREIVNLQKQLDDEVKALHKNNAEIAKLESNREQIRKLEKTNSTKNVNNEVLFGTLNQKNISAKSQLIDEEKTVAGLETEQKNAKHRTEEIDRLLKDIAEKMKNLNERKASAKTNVGKRKSDYDALKGSHDKLQTEVVNARLNLSQLKMKIENDEKDIVLTGNSISRNDRLVAESSKQILIEKQSIAELETELQKSSKTAASYDLLDDVKKQLADADKNREQIKSEYDIANREQAGFASEEVKLKEKRLREEYNLETTESNIEQLRETIWNEYQVTYSNALQFKDESYDPTNSHKEISRLRTERGRMGLVNVTAVESYGETYDRYNQIKEQLDDLKKAEADLNLIIKDLTKEMVTRFNEGFETINQNFTSVFREFFGGGNSRLIIEKDPEKEELEWGIEIEAQPPGKRLQNISLLSGGERTMTAIAILFAILKLRPMPFCVLDEIEAALDESNCDRIAKYIKKFSEDTQFLLITHKKPTMEISDVLYGVTMEEKGVSKVVSVKLTEAIKHIGA